MIKLNNKNITYVALADSNNSLKAPKEIWYADSNNSVKLVYRRKDALIEGEDYEKYHWLDGENGAYINTHTPITAFSDVLEFEFIVKSTNSQNGNVEMIGTLGDDFRIICFGGNYIYLAYCNIYDAGTQDYFIENTGTILKVILSSDGTHYYRNVNGVDLQPCDVGNMAAGDYGELLIFRIRPPQGYENHYYDGKFSYIKLGTKLHLIPCKLLKPVPKWLDANGIRRQVGECGMIDLVSGKFYGNVNSVGTFTVENYYERKEWLIGDGSAYIDTGHNTNEDLDWETKVGNIRDNTFLFWFRTIQGIGDESMIVRTAPSRFRYANNSIEFEDNLTSQPINVETFGTTIFINGIEHSITKYYPRPSILFRLFYAEVDAASQTTVDTGYTTNNVGCSYFRFLDSNRNYIQNLIPCTLTMDLPASMDANNIARTKGTSGMWDLVSDRFYGNVANSGTFKAVNLAEGVDYEVHQWLVADIPIGVTLMSLPINSSTFSYQTVLGEQQANIGHFMTNGYSYVTNNNSMDIVKIYDNVNKQTVSSSSVNSRSMGIESSENGMTVNGVNIQQLGFPVKNKLITSASNSLNATTKKTSKITVDGVDRYIPCKLLKPVPKWLDANGIRRQIGECGMIDLISGKFYGNVNSVGTFTVENYYERKEWLIGDGSAYIDTGHNVNENLDWETEVICPDTTTGTHFFWYRPIAAGSSTTMIARTNNSTYVGLRIANNSNQIYWQDTSNQTVVKCDSNTIRINDVSYTVTKSYGLSQEFYLFNIKLEDGTPTPSTSNGVKCSYFNFFDTNKNYIQNLIPCTLTMDLPASMDANNTPRTKGTSGMWDLVSDRFYGNVASSGTFKAVNLAEGVDYERHQWLVGDGSSTIKVIGNIYREAFSLVTVPTTTAALRNLTRAINASYDGNYSEYQILINGASKFSIRHGIRINNIPTAIIAEFSDNYVNNEYEITTYRDGDYYYGNINGVEYKNDINFGEYQFADEDIEINILSYGFKLGNFNSGRVNLIPVKLLHSISSKYDADGIARQAGECGMYDTVNDKFYGNVASSGTFSVSDDE